MNYNFAAKLIPDLRSLHSGNPVTEERQRTEGVPHKFALRIANLWGPRRGQKGQVF
ncbi:hypothetical protein [Fischerella thermalis]|uniref:hypothetical protein n=1 Tax=Fischerella thermalis TaxID=372787 RepID=UPI00307D7B32